MSRLLPVMLVAAWVSTASAQENHWRYVPASRPHPRPNDASLVLAGRDHRSWPAGARLSDTTSAYLVVACGAPLPEPEGRTLYFRSAEAMEPFGGEGYARLRFDDHRWEITTWVQLTDHPPIPATLPAGSSTLRLGFLGDDDSPYYSSDLLREMLAARTLTVTYLAFGEERSVSFDVAGLAEQLPRLGSCAWPTPS